MEDPFYRTLNRVRVLEDDLRVEVDRKIKLESRSNVIAYELDYNKKKCTRVLPDIRSAKEAMCDLPTHCLTEIKTFKAPPQDIKTVLECLMIVLDGADSHFDYWTASRKLFSNPKNFFRRIRDFDPTSVEGLQVRAIRQRLRAMPVGKTRASSKATACLHQWILNVLEYWQSFMMIKPYVDKIYALEDEQNKLSYDLGETLKNIDCIEINLRQQLDKKRRYLEPSTTLNRWAEPRRLRHLTYDYDYTI